MNRQFIKGDIRLDWGQHRGDIHTLIALGLVYATSLHLSQLRLFDWQRGDAVCWVGQAALGDSGGGLHVLLINVDDVDEEWGQ